MDAKITRKITEKDILEVILKKASKTITAGELGLVTPVKDFVNGIPGAKAKETVSNILKGYDFVFSINAGSYEGDAKKTKQQLLEYFKKTFGVEVKANIIKISDIYNVFCPVFFQISYFDQIK